MTFRVFSCYPAMIHDVITLLGSKLVNCARSFPVCRDVDSGISGATGLVSGGLHLAGVVCRVCSRKYFLFTLLDSVYPQEFVRGAGKISFALIQFTMPMHHATACVPDERAAFPPQQAAVFVAPSWSSVLARLDET